MVTIVTAVPGAPLAWKGETAEDWTVMAALLGDRYELDGVLGHGGMAEVRRAWDTRLGRQVAVKILRRELAEDDTFRARFRREAHAVAALSHPAIVAVYDSGETDIGGLAVPYLVMEYVQGRTLRALLDEGFRPSPWQALQIVDDVLSALEHSHRAGIVHRDIKPSNVMVVDAVPRPGGIKVMDFGIARPLDGEGAITATAQIVGTAQYMAPEQVRGGPVDARSDVYATGCLLYELLTGRAPFTGGTALQTAEQHLREVPVPPSRLNPGLPAWADAIVSRALAKDPGARYQSAAEMRADVRRAMTPQVPAAAPHSPGPAPTMILERPYDGGDGEPSTAAVPRRRSGRGRIVLAMTLFAVVLAGAAAGVTYLLVAPEHRTVEVPNVVGLARASAERTLTEAGLRPDTRQEFSAEQAAGFVIRSEPEAGRTVSAGDRVVIWVSKGPEQITVPEVAGATEAEARQRLQDLGLLVVTQQEPSDSVEPGGVVRSEPAAGSTVNRGATVILYLSSGPALPQVPDVTGHAEGEARRVLEEAGFTVLVRDVPAGGADTPDTVVAQNPAPGSAVAQGTQVTIWVARAQGQPVPPTAPTDVPIVPPTIPSTLPPLQ